MWIHTTNICGWIKLIHISLSDNAIRPPCDRIISKVGDVDANVLDVDVDGWCWCKYGWKYGYCGVDTYICGWIKLMQMSLSDSARRASLVAELLKCQLRTPMDSHGHPERIAVNSQQRQCVSLSWIHWYGHPRHHRGHWPCVKLKMAPSTKAIAKCTALRRCTLELIWGRIDLGKKFCLSCIHLSPF